MEAVLGRSHSAWYSERSLWLLSFEKEWIFQEVGLEEAGKWRKLVRCRHVSHQTQKPSCFFTTRICKSPPQAYISRVAFECPQNSPFLLSSDFPNNHLPNIFTVQNQHVLLDFVKVHILFCLWWGKILDWYFSCKKLLCASLFLAAEGQHIWGHNNGAIFVERTLIKRDKFCKRQSSFCRLPPFSPLPSPLPGCDACTRGLHSSVQEGYAENQAPKTNIPRKARGVTGFFLTA